MGISWRSRFGLAALALCVSTLIAPAPAAYAQDRPFPPQGVTATSGPGSVTVTWYVVSDDGSRAPVTDYLVTIYPETTHVAASRYSLAGSVRFDGLAAGTTYIAHVRAINSYGAGAPSPDVTAIPDPVVPIVIGGTPTPDPSIGPVTNTPSALSPEETPTPSLPSLTITIPPKSGSPGGVGTPGAPATASAPGATTSERPAVVPSPTGFAEAGTAAGTTEGTDASGRSGGDTGMHFGWYAAGGLLVVALALLAVLVRRRRG